MFTGESLREISDKAIAALSSPHEADKLYAPMRYILSQGGKRLRPVMCLMACNLFSDKIEEAVMPAVGVEIFHNFTLVHDDILDNSGIRRGSPTVHAKWGPNQALLSGDVMAFVSSECIATAPERTLSKVLRLFNRTAIEVCVGQQMDLDFETKAVVSETEYIRMIELKTGVLIATALKIGALIGSAPERDQDLLYDFGKYLGLAFQIQDDLLDTYGDSKMFGKKTGGDIVSNKKTYLLVKALELAGGEKLKGLRHHLSLKKFDEEKKIEAVKAIFDDLDVRLIAENKAYEYINKAFECLESVSVKTERKNELKQLAIGLIGRVR